MTDADNSLPILLDPLDSSTPRALPLLTLTDLRIAEAQAAAALPEHTLMARAGHAAARWLLERIAADTSVIKSQQRVWLAAGPGNNGGDALVVATQLHKAGIAVEVCMPIEVKPADARWALDAARAAGVPIDTAPPASLDGYGWLVDGMFGIGLARELDGVFAAIARQLSQRTKARPSQGAVLALDVPSGLDSDTGAVIGGAGAAVVHATHTITFIGAKPGLFTAQGRDLAGQVTVAPIGLSKGVNGNGNGAGTAADGDASGSANGNAGTTRPAPRAAIQLNAPELFAPFMPPRDFATNKGTFGSLAVVGGDTGMCGAPILAARAALYSGAGKVHVALLGEGAPPYDPPHPELMLHPVDTLPLDQMDALAIGCGMGQRERATKVLHDVLALDVPKLFDADALNLFAQDPALAAELTARGVQGDPCILTPHPLEAARLLGSDARSVQRDRLAAARALAARFASVVVLKGVGTIVAAPDGRLALNPTGNAALATGGTGDVLGGIIGALLAQHLPRYEAALAGVYLHGLAADTLTAQGQGPAGLTAGELAPMVRTLLNRLFYPL
ncbi:bifunctional ADP-dependent (S)-NAD(P)H-hydrate dehydratase/NAD(P)H-hydrate epimerase [Burkholderia sp. SRS-W-2-2016]|uniref:bifunctional ADP-dependent NAD(P)H-hydrate dehydratase/NAD(P)H-hydrate epimerase n=1 Tax=Burkholderia sp. SRS-W-2-2016 TaxID=1926878 RepID=UPI00094B686C|nr:bifunctional ADP-dependent NAD(P)H-hydrate dehydratase/NAD(P)H-hydrate epimerase [Burkholderia sp. SRS-W-2-2016]OLL31360.1 bifunctional ADP-dependent (S)-NAD(P)H-hydrate dehydratase/NAD(P)H-hydrate epimerase [Burkholderia sp. SRS-W-2-2016]